MYAGLHSGPSKHPSAEEKQAYCAREQDALVKTSSESSSEIVEQLMMQEGSINYLAGMLERLRSKLYPVLLLQPEKDGGGCSPAAPSLSPFGEALRSHTCRIQSCTVEVEKMLQQLSV